MYSSNRNLYLILARNNLVSTVDLLWKQSLEDENKFSTALIKNKKNN